MLAIGYRIKEISLKMHISLRTTTTHQENIYRKLQIHHKSALLQYSPNYDELISKLTPKEALVIELLSQDLSSEDIASELNLSIETINSHRKSINKKIKKIQEKYDILGI